MVDVPISAPHFSLCIEIDDSSDQRIRIPKFQQFKSIFVSIWASVANLKNHKKWKKNIN